MTAQSTVIVGGGASGFITALRMLEEGVPADQIHIVEADPSHFGGKIRSASLTLADGSTKTVDMGAEFIGKEDKLVAIAKKLDVRLIPASEQEQERFFGSDGKEMPDFLEKMRPIARRMQRLNEAAEGTIPLESLSKRDQELVAKLQFTSAKELMQELHRDTPVEESRGFLRSIGDMIYNAFMIMTFQSKRANRVPPEVVATAMSGVEQELGASSPNISAEHLVSEFFPDDTRFLTSGCDLRVEGGMGHLFAKMQEHLKARGVKFTQGHQLTSVQDGSSKTLTFKTKEGQTTLQADNVVMALPAYALPQIEYLDASGKPDLKMAFLKDMGNVQYTKNAKITIATKPGALPTDEANIFIPGAECWSSGPGSVTFLCHNSDGRSPVEVMEQAMQAFAKASGKRVEDVFFVQQGSATPQAGSFVYTNPGKTPCWSTPDPRNMAKMETYFEKMHGLGARGIGFVGTYMPVPDGSVGFMENGAVHAEELVHLMKETGRFQGCAPAQELCHNLPLHAKTLADRVRSGKESSSAGMLI